MSVCLSVNRITTKLRIKSICMALVLSTNSSTFQILQSFTSGDTLLVLLNLYTQDITDIAMSLKLLPSYICSISTEVVTHRALNN